MNKAALSLGANVDDRLGHMRLAVGEISARTGRVIARSWVYETEPWGRVDQPRFLNACVILETELPPLGLLEEFKKIETETGRLKRAHWGPREIDIDIIFFDDLVLDDKLLTIPHRLMQLRSFVLVPLNEIAPDWRHPADGRTVRDLSESVSHEGVVRITPL
jgi:2-amino-4-hydroxy-6-hydroxymethyldihydropteridine diphosphokinase